jgi:NAD(P)-dependent dehydrogenase (short-subunit alcohol dehydrogenase family)
MTSLASLLPNNAHALIVGGTAGIGAAIAHKLALALPPTSQITIAGRNATAAQRIIDGIRNEISAQGDTTTSSGVTMNFAAVDCGKMSDVKRFCKDYRRNVLQEPTHKLDLLVLTPGILAMDGRQPASPGSTLDLKMSLHYYARMLIIRELLPCLAENATVLSVLDGKRSDARASGIKWDDMDLSHPGNYGVSKAAEHCLTFTDIQLQDFAEQSNKDTTSHSAPHHTFIHAYPGIVATELFNTARLPWYVRLGAKGFAAVLAVSPETCAERLLHGVAECKEKDLAGGEASTVAGSPKGLWNIDDKGKILTNKNRADRDTVEKVREHTWHAVDSQPANA